MIALTLQNIGHRIVQQLQSLGQFVAFCTLTAQWLAIDLFRPRRWRLILPQLYEVGTKSIPVVMLTGAFIGMILAVELFEQFKLFGMENRLGGVVSISIVKHLGPVLAAIMLAGRVGGAFAAELGTMAVTEQIDAMRVMGAAPPSYLVVPRVVACVIMIPILTIFSDLLGIVGGLLIIVGANNVTSYDFWVNAAEFVEPWDVTAGLIKSVFFGLAIGLISCYKGFNCGPGAQGVGKATTNAFVSSFVTIIILNFFLAKLTQDLYKIIWGASASAFG